MPLLSINNSLLLSKTDNPVIGMATLPCCLTLSTSYISLVSHLSDPIGLDFTNHSSPAISPYISYRLLFHQYYMTISQKSSGFENAPFSAPRPAWQSDRQGRQTNNPLISQKTRAPYKWTYQFTTDSCPQRSAFAISPINTSSLAGYYFHH